MIKINGINYNNYETEVSFNNFIYGKEKGIAPYISFSIENINIYFETIFNEYLLNKLEINKEEDITKYITDIGYEDGSGWMSLIHEKYNFKITKLNKNDFHLSIEITSKDITIDTIIKINDK